ncbi:MAG: hypothetical protein WA984_10475 [Phormidesmis sp.]
MAGRTENESKSIDKSKMAAAMNTSRTSFDRLLDPDNTSVTLKTMDRAAAVLGKRLRIDLVDANDTEAVSGA